MEHDANQNPPAVVQPAPIEPRQLTPVQNFWPGNPSVKNFSPQVVPADTPPTDAEIAAVEDALTPVPKDESALASVTSSVSDPVTPPVESVHRVPQSVSTQTPESGEDADRESGKVSALNGAAPPTLQVTTPSPETSSPSSSSPKRPGASVPPVPVPPPISAPTPTP